MPLPLSKPLEKGRLPGWPLASRPGRSDLMELKLSAYRSGQTAGFLEAALEHIDDPAWRARLRLKARSAPNNEAAEAIIKAELRDYAVSLLDGRGKLADEEARLTRVLGAMNELLAHLKSAGKTLRPVDESLFHKVHEEGVTHSTMWKGSPPEEIERSRNGECGVFLMQHDWASLLNGAEVDRGDFRLPFEQCCFEFASGKTRVCLLISCDDGVPYQALPLFRTSFGWLLQCPMAIDGEGLAPWEAASESDSEIDPYLQCFFDQVRAVAIMLDAEVISREVVRAPYRLNATRIDRGKPPLYDHHVLSIRRRSTPNPLPRSDAPFTPRRLHFRRGHWRHYQNHKTWIRWMLVGDASRGFADKDYRL